MSNWEDSAAMPYNFIIQIVFFLAVGLAVVIIARALPRIEDEVSEKRSARDRISRLANKIPLDKMDESINIISHKVLRRLKVAILKADNAISGKLQGFGGAVKKEKANLPLVEKKEEEQ
ncbi:MAG: hypothetical protein PHP35_01520 [Candidatus Colwellbacteria bacterium]|nr:hypothetical protein [Candidatus Colwellbacteria bacterium]